MTAGSVKSQMEQRIAHLLETDSQFAAARPIDTVTAAIDKAGLGLAAIIETVMSGYAERPALGQRTFSIAVDPATGRRVAQLGNDFETVSYGELWRRVNAVASGLSDDVKMPDACVCVLGFTSVDYTTVDLALAVLGVVAVPLQSGAPVDLLRPIVAETNPSVIVCDVQNLAAAAELAAAGHDARRIVIINYHPIVDDHRDSYDEAILMLRRAGSPAAIEPLVDLIERGNVLPAKDVPCEGKPDQLSLLVYTSGSTGAPKGAMFPERLVADLWRPSKRGAQGDRAQVPVITLNFFPMSHLAGRINLYGTLAAGGTAYFTARSDLSTFLDDLAITRPTRFAFVPRIWEMLAQHFQAELHRRTSGSLDTDALKTQLLDEHRQRLLGGRFLVASCGSAPLSAELKEFAETLLEMPVIEGYGSTEVLGGITIGGRVQRPPVIDYKLVDVPELGYYRTDRPHPRGELLVKSESIFGGYYRRPEVTAAVFDSDGFYRTGDIVAETGPDEVAYLDRRNNVVKLAQGEFVTISKLEAIFGASPQIHQIYVYGNSARAYLLAVVVPGQEVVTVAGGDTAIVRLVISEALQKAGRVAGLQSYEIPRDFIIDYNPFTLDNGLLTGIGKLARPKLQQHYGADLEQLYIAHAEGQAEQLRTLRQHGADGPVPLTIGRAVAAVLGLTHADLTPDTHFTDLGGDSLSALTLANLLQEIYDMDVPVSVIVSPASDLQHLADFIGKSQRGGADRPSFAAVHGHHPVEVSAGDLDLEKFISEGELATAASLPAPGGEVRNVLLTGATGFLGRFLALEWLHRLSSVEGKLTCLVRAKDDDGARARLDSVYNIGSPSVRRRYHELANRHLEVIAADKGEPRLGVDDATWHQLAESVDLIVDPAALVNHVLPYDQMFGPNVVGTAELIRLALSSRIKPYVYVSTAGIGVGLSPAEFNEDNDIRVAVPRRMIDDTYANGYVTSKWAGEVLLRNANEKCGLPVSVFRSGMIMADAMHTGQLNVPDLFTRLILSVVATGIAPYSFYELDDAGKRRHAHFDGLPVDFIAEAICSLSNLGTGEFSTYHVANPHRDGVGLDTYVDWLIDAGVAINRIQSYSNWLQRFEGALRALPDNQRRNSVLPLIHNYYHPQVPQQGPLVSANRFQAAVQAQKIGPDNDIPHVSPAIIANYLDSLKQLGLL